MAQPRLPQDLNLPPLLSKAEAARPLPLRDWLEALRNEAEAHFSSLAGGVRGMSLADERHLTVCLGDLSAGTTIYWLGNATAAYTFVRQTELKRLTVQGDMVAGASITVTVYNDTESAGTRALEVVDSSSTGRVALDTSTPTNNGKELFDAEKLFVKVVVATQAVNEVCIELGFRPT